MAFAGSARTVSRVVRAIEQSEGAGARVRRSIGTQQLRNFSPFLMLDHFRVPKGAGFPDHPHRGQETVTYMLEGSFQHEDFAGHAGEIAAGDLQWMTAGRGIMHAEMPLQDSEIIPTGLQLWVDLPSAEKMCEPRYQELKDTSIPRVNPNDLVEVKVISGESYGTSSPVQTKAGVWYLDIRVKAGGKLRQPIPEGWNAFLYTLDGDIDVAGKKVGAFNTVVLTQEGGGLEVENPASGDARFVLIAGEPLDQEVVQYGPFVMDTPEGIRQAFTDYQTKSNGFERAASWGSKIGAHMM
ncbi:RNA pol II transcription cofactor [Savitreella phatthalungensis]